MSVKITDRDLGWKRLHRELEKARGKPHVVVGVFGEKAAADHGGVPNIQIATAHEFGLDIKHPGGTAYFPGLGKAVFVSNETAAEFARDGRELPRTAPHIIPIPERSFIRGTVDEKQKAIVKMAKGLAGAVLEGVIDTQKALEALGVYVQGLIRGRMSKGIPPPLKPATIKRKGSSKPLIDTGQLRASIDSEVRKA